MHAAADATHLVPSGATAALHADPEWVRLVQGMSALATLAMGRQGEEGMRRHYLALMQACSAQMGAMLAAQAA